MDDEDRLLLALMLFIAVMLAMMTVCTLTGAEW